MRTSKFFKQQLKYKRFISNKPLDIVFEIEDLVTEPIKSNLDEDFWNNLNSKEDGKTRPLRHRFLNHYLPMPYYVNLPDINICNAADEFFHHKNLTKTESYGNYDEIPEKKFVEIGKLKIRF